MSHMTQTANPVTLLASPLGEEGHEVAKGVQANWIHRGEKRPANPVRRHPAKSVWTRVRMIMILDVDVTAERRHNNTHRPHIARKGDTTTLGAKGPVKLKNPWAEGPSILRTFPSEPSEPFEPGRRRRLNPHVRILHRMRKSAEVGP